jgi:hypothetical protein
MGVVSSVKRASDEAEVAGVGGPSEPVGRDEAVDDGDRCDDCRRLIRCAVTVHGKRVCLDPAPVTDGNVALVLVDGEERARLLPGSGPRPEGVTWRLHRCRTARPRVTTGGASCAVCGYRLAPALVADGERVHPCCSGDEQ